MKAGTIVLFVASLAFGILFQQWQPKQSDELPQAKPAEAKPAEVKPAEVKPAEVKPAEVKPLLGVVAGIKRGTLSVEIDRMVGMPGLVSSKTGSNTTMIWVGSDATLFCVLNNGVVMDFTILGQ